MHHALHPLLRILEELGGKSLALWVLGWGIILFCGFLLCLALALLVDDTRVALLRRLRKQSPDAGNSSFLRTDTFQPENLGYLVLFLVGLGIGIALVHYTGRKADPSQAAQAIEACHGVLTRDENAADRPILTVSFRGQPLGDAELAGLREELAALSELRELDLTDTAITDKGLEHLKALKHLGHLEKLKLGRSSPPQPGAPPAELTLSGITGLRFVLPQAEIHYDDGLSPFGSVLIVPARK